MEFSQKLPPIGVLEGRQDFVIERCRGKRVLHIGCVDAGVLEERFRAGVLMHQQIARVASELWGLDIDAKGIAFLEGKGFKNLIFGDFSELEPAKWELLSAQAFDLIVIPEVVEHLMNPGRFLAAARALMAERDCDLIVSVPNAFRLDTLIGLFRGVENVHPDHNYYFSYHTATNLLKKSGLSVKEVYLYSFESAAVLGRWLRPPSGGGTLPGEEEAKRDGSLRQPTGGQSFQHRVLAFLFYRFSPFWADGLILVATPDEGNNSSRPAGARS